MSVIQRAMTLAKQYQTQGYEADLDKLTWDREKNSDLMFGHQIKVYIPTPYDLINRIVNQYGIHIEYRDVEYPVTATDWKHKRCAITMPHPDAFVSMDRYAAVLTHELTHSTQVVLNRDLVPVECLIPAFLVELGLTNYGRMKEEMVAEWTSFRLMERVGVDTEELASPYIASNLQYIPEYDRDSAIKEVEGYVDEAFNFLVNLGA